MTWFSPCLFFGQGDQKSVLVVYGVQSPLSATKLIALLRFPSPSLALPLSLTLSHTHLAFFFPCLSFSLTPTNVATVAMGSVGKLWEMGPCFFSLLVGASLGARPSFFLYLTLPQSPLCLSCSLYVCWLICFAPHPLLPKFGFR